MTMTRNDEIAALLPFYVTGRLDDIEHARVAKWIEEDPLGRQALQNALDEHAHVISANESITPPAGALGRLMADIEHEPQQRGSMLKVRGLWTRLIDRLNTTPPVLAWAASAAMLAIVVVQTGALIQQQPIDRPYVVSAGGEETQSGRTFIVAFSDKATIAIITKALADANAGIVAGPIGRGTYQIRFQDNKDYASIEKRLAQLKARSDLVTLIVEKKSSD